MSMLIKEEKKALRDELERTYGIRIHDDDELLPILHYITDASKLASLHLEESRNILTEMKTASSKMIEDHTSRFQILLNDSGQMLNRTAVQSKEMIVSTKKELEGFPKIVKDFNTAITSLKIPQQVTIKKISFENSTMSFLWKYFTISALVIAINVPFSFWWISQVSKESERANFQTKEWLMLYFDKMKIEAPNATNKFIEQHPIPFNIKQTKP